MGLVSRLKAGWNIYLAYNCVRQEEFERAVELLDAVIPHVATSEIYNTRGYANLNSGNWQRAREDFSKAIELQPVFPMAYLNRGVTARRIGDLEQAQSDLEAAIAQMPSYQAPQAELCKLDIDRQYFGAAIDRANKLCSQDRAFSEFIFLRGLARYFSGEHHAAIADFREFRRIYPGDGYAAIFEFLNASRMGRADRQLLEQTRAEMPARWPRPALELLLDQMPLTAFLAHIPSQPRLARSLPTELEAEKWYFVGQKYLIDENPSDARACFQRVLSCDLSYLHVSLGAAIELQRLDGTAEALNG